MAQGERPTFCWSKTKLRSARCWPVASTPGGARVVSADNGEDTLLLVEEGPNSIILDWMMPKLSGIRVCLRLKLGPETRAIPIIMLSARMTK